MLIELPAPQLLELGGPDAAAFAQAQFANDLRALAPGHWQWNAWLSPQGRVRYLFALLRVSDERLLMLLRGGDAAQMREELSRYVFRAKVSLQLHGDWHMLGADEADMRAAGCEWPHGDNVIARGDGFVLRLPFGNRALIVATGGCDASPGANALAQWRLEDIRAGLADIVPALKDRLLPQWLGLQRLPAFSVAKGCYPGQEIVARLHFKGGNKRSLYRVAFACGELPEPGTTLSEGADQGVLVQAQWTAPQHAEGLAVLPDGWPGASSDAAAGVQVISRFS